MAPIVAAASADGEATRALWAGRSHQAPAVVSAAALIGSDTATLHDAVAITLAASDEATALLDGMELRVRTLTTTVETDAQRCVHSVRGPVLWSETITARANALGNDDVFVCMTSARSFDTVENRVLVAALEAIARAERALRTPTGEKVDPAERTRIAEVAAEARRWRAHPRLAAIRGGRLTGRDAARLRSGHRVSRMAPVMAVRSRVAEPFVADDLAGLADPSTRALHGFVLGVTEALRELEVITGTWSASDGGLWSGALSWRHPSADGGTPPGLCFRGIPLLAPAQLLESVPWADRLPHDGVTVRSALDVEQLVDRLNVGAPARARRTRPAGSAQRSSSS